MNRFCSIFSQLLQLFPRWEFQQLVLETKAERHARGFSSWGQFVAMLFCQLGRAHSLREICGGLASALSGKFTPLLRASFRRQLCCATSKYSRHCCVARLTDDENPSRINDTNFPDSTLAVKENCIILESLLPSAPPSAMPMSIDPGNCTKRFFTACLIVV